MRRSSLRKPVRRSGRLRWAQTVVVGSVAFGSLPAAMVKTEIVTNSAPLRGYLRSNNHGFGRLPFVICPSAYCDFKIINLNVTNFSAHVGRDTIHPKTQSTFQRPSHDPRFSETHSDHRGFYSCTSKLFLWFPARS